MNCTTVIGLGRCERASWRPHKSTWLSVYGLDYKVCSCNSMYRTRLLGNGRPMATTPQFRGSHRRFQHELIWKAWAENKCKIHTWIPLHNKILTADNLQKRDRPHQDHCVLCNDPLETGLYLSLLCPFAKAVWEQVLSWENFSVQWPQHDPTSLADWWELEARRVPKQDRRRFNGVVIYIMWNVEGER
jgi:hypothetical protein